MTDTQYNQEHFNGHTVEGQVTGMEIGYRWHEDDFGVQFYDEQGMDVSAFVLFPSDELPRLIEHLQYVLSRSAERNAQEG